MDVLTQIEKNIFDTAKKSDLIMVKAYIKNTFNYSYISDKIVYKKLVKIALKIFSQKDLQDFFGECLTEKIDNYWNKNTDMSFQTLSNILIDKFKKYDL